MHEVVASGNSHMIDKDKDKIGDAGAHAPHEQPRRIICRAPKKTTASSCQICWHFECTLNSAWAALWPLHNDINSVAGQDNKSHDGPPAQSDNGADKTTQHARTPLRKSLL